MSEMAWKWVKPPKPAQLAKLVPALRQNAVKTLAKIAPHIAVWLVNRIRQQSLIAHRGRLKPIPEYSDRYEEQLRQAGQSTRPDYTVTGILLDHLGGKVRVKNAEQVELRIAPYGRASNLSGVEYTKGAKGKKGTEHEGYWWRSPYSYTIPKSGKVVNVAGQWIKVPWNAKDAEGVKKRRKRTVYNAHLANQLAMRLGGGSWAKVRMGTQEAPNSFLTLTTAELEIVHKELMAGSAAAGKVIIAAVAGK